MNPFQNNRFYPVFRAVFSDTDYSLKTNTGHTLQQFIDGVANEMNMGIHWPKNGERQLSILEQKYVLMLHFIYNHGNRLLRDDDRHELEKFFAAASMRTISVYLGVLEQGDDSEFARSLIGLGLSDKKPQYQYRMTTLVF